ncbi:protein translocase subunit SecD [Candidatus Kuenenia sp.]|uniref:protein translocase subunit SecD n=1 Tax=Candidatus Kuenenia sp. TaxID=2499824 RepID=UPI00322016FB
MGKNLRWKIPLIVIVIAIGFMILYPPAEKVLKREMVKEADGKVIESKIVEKAWTHFLVTNPIIRETIIGEEIGTDGKKITTKTVEYFTKGKIKLGLDLKGGSELLYTVRVDDREDRPGITKEIIEVLKKRIDPQGVMEYRIQEQGHRRILIQVPGATRSETESLKNRITKLGKLEFRLAASTDSVEYKDATEGKSVPGYYKHWLRKRKGEEGEEGKWFLVRNTTEITGEHLSRIYADTKGIEPVVGFEFDAAGKSKFGQITERNIGKPLAIILDGILYSAPTIRDRIPGKGIIEGNFTQDEVNELIATMRAGSLPADLELEMETMVGPSLGRDSINKGLTAGIIGGIFVVLFIGIYYLGIGWVANFANALNVFLIIGIMALLNATLTLPGIAGLVLMIGMGVDANVLIYERIREERAKGKPIRAAVKAGYQKAFSAIFDSNITTLITGVILASVGTGPVKGFAWILIIGLIINLFTAIFVTRTIYELLMDFKWVKSFSMLRIIGVPNIRFLSIRHILFIVSGVCVLGGMTFFVIRGDKKYDIDFTGGTLVHLHLKNETTPGFIRTSLKDAGYEEAEVQSIWSGENLTQFVSKADEFGIRIKEINEEKEKQKIVADISNAFGQTELFQSIDFIKPTIFNLKLQRPIDELAVQKNLKQAGYSEEDVASIMPVNLLANKYLLNTAGIDEEPERLNLIGAMVNGLKDHLVFQEAKITLGDVVETLQAQMPGPFIEADLNKQIAPVLLEIELNRQGFNNVKVTEQPGSEKRGSVSKLRIEGPRTALQNIKQSFNEKISLPGVYFDEDTAAVKVELKEKISKSDFVSMISKIRAMKNMIKSIYTLDAPAQTFAIHLNPLSAEKIQEKIKEDIINKFKDNLYEEEINVAFQEIGDFQFNMTLSKPLRRETIEKTLNSAGYAGLLAENLAMDKEYQTVTLAFNEQQNVGAAKEAIQKAFVVPNPLKRVVSIGSTVADEMKSRAILGVFFACAATIFYVWFRFGDFRFGSAAIIAVIHDILVTLGVVAAADYLFGNMKFDSSMVAAFLAVVGYSLNDTIIVFDRIRENMGGRGKILNAQLINESISQTLSRTILTSVTTIGVLFSLFFLGGAEIHGFAFVMLTGIIVGTYSSIFIASPLLLSGQSAPKTSHTLQKQKGKAVVTNNA